MANGWHRSHTTKFKKRKIYSSHKDDIWGADLAGVKLINKYNNEVGIFLSDTSIYGKYTWVVPVKDMKGISITNAI